MGGWEVCGGGGEEGGGVLSYVFQGEERTKKGAGAGVSLRGEASRARRRARASVERPLTGLMAHAGRLRHLDARVAHAHSVQSARMRPCPTPAYGPRVRTQSAPVRDEPCFRNV